MVRPWSFQKEKEKTINKKKIRLLLLLFKQSVSETKPWLFLHFFFYFCHIYNIYKLDRKQNNLIIFYFFYCFLEIFFTWTHLVKIEKMSISFFLKNKTTTTTSIPQQQQHKKKQINLISLSKKRHLKNLFMLTKKKET